MRFQKKKPVTGAKGTNHGKPYQSPCSTATKSSALATLFLFRCRDWNQGEMPDQPEREKLSRDGKAYLF